MFAAYDEQIERKVALKILHQAPNDSTLQRMRTLREARAAARISHPNIIAIYEVGETEGRIHIAMEYVDGGTLLAWQNREERSWREILRIYLQVGEALLAAHQANVVHRDFKPDNVLLGRDGRPRVVDFGLARVGWTDANSEPADTAGPPSPDAEAPGAGRITQKGVIFGTPGYMSPEQHRGGDVDNRSDQWSFCAALYEALYGVLPFAGTTLNEQALRIQQETPRLPPPGSKVPDEIRQALFRGLAPDPGQRFPSMAELIAILSPELHGGAAGSSVSRQRFIRAWITAVLVALTVVQLRYIQEGAPPRATGVIWAVITLVVLLGGLGHRQTLLNNRFHRHVWILILVTVVLFFLQRRVGTALGLSVRQIYPFHMVGMASMMALIAATLIPKLFFLPLVPLLACIVSLTTAIPERVLTLVYPLTALCLVIGWSRAARYSERSIGEPDIGSAAKTWSRR